MKRSKGRSDLDKLYEISLLEMNNFNPNYEHQYPSKQNHSKLPNSIQQRGDEILSCNLDKQIQFANPGDSNSSEKKGNATLNCKRRLVNQSENATLTDYCSSRQIATKTHSCSVQQRNIVTPANSSSDIHRENFIHEGCSSVEQRESETASSICVKQKENSTPANTCCDKQKGTTTPAGSNADKQRGTATPAVSSADKQSGNKKLGSNSDKQRGNEIPHSKSVNQNVNGKPGSNFNRQKNNETPGLKSINQRKNEKLGSNYDAQGGLQTPGSRTVKQRPGSKKDKQTGTQNSKPDVESTEWTTKAVFTIHKQFEGTLQLRDKMSSFIKKTNSNLQNIIVGEPIICAEFKSICTIVLTTISKQSAINFIIDLHRILHTNLKTTVHFQISSTKKARDAKTLKDKKEKCCHIKIPASQNTVVAEGNSEKNKYKNSDQCLQVEKNIKDSSSNGKDSSIMNSVAKVQEKSTEVSSIPEVKETIKLISGVNVKEIQSDIKDTSPTCSSKRVTDAKGPGLPIPTMVKVKVFAGNLNRSSISNLFSLLKEPHVKPEHITVESSNNSQTICRLLTSSKAAAKRVTKLINGTKLKVSMRALVETEKECELYEAKKYWKFKAENKDHTEAKCERLKNELTSLLFGVKLQNVAKHDEKIEEHRHKLKEITQIVDESDVDGDEKMAILDKLQELEKQKQEFLKKWEQLNMKATTIAVQDAGNSIMRQIGIECNRLKMALPMYARRQDILDKVSSNQVSIILGETGSGKSTQLVQYLYEAGLAKDGPIVCTQPRKVAAIALAERVAQEMVTNVGKLVGYKTGVKKRISRDTQIIFSTDHCLLNECLKNKDFSGYSCIIVDEAHERSIYTDLLLGMIKTCLPNRPDLKVIITSATIDPAIFIKYFDSTPELFVSGRMFPVDIIYDDSDTDVEFEDHERKAVAKAIEVHKTEPPGDVLVFLTSPVEIMRCCEEFERQMRGVNNFKCFPLHGQLPPEEQKKVFNPLPLTVRKIVFATNCAETSFTIDGIKYVIDTGVAKEVKYDAKKNISVLGTHIISKSSADQRKGRAGRTASGKCFRLYSESGYKSMEPSSKPEILRVHLGQAVLKLSALGIDCRSCDFVQSPGRDAIDAAMSTLGHLGAMSKDGITELGKWINNLPFDPRQGFLIYHGFKNNILYDSIVIASLLNNGSNIFYKGMSETEQQKSSKSKIDYGSNDGDVFTWLEIYKDWSKVAKRSQSKWCKEKCINYKVVNYTKQSVNEMAQILQKEAGVHVENTFGDIGLVTSLFKKLLFQAYMSSLSHYLGHLKAGYHALEVQKQVHFHPSSSLLSLNAKPEWIVYTEFIKTTRDFIKGISIVDEVWVQEALQEGKLSFDIEEVNGRKIEVVHKEEIGLTMFRNLVGPKYSKLRELEDELSNSGMTTVVVEADRELGTIDVYSSSPMNSNVASKIKQCKETILQSLKLDEDEISVIKNTNGSDKTGFRVVLGQGAIVKSLLMPDESNKIIIMKSSFRTSEEEIRQKFAVFGEIVECIKFKGSNPWGCIRYRTKYEAGNAVKGTRNDEQNSANLKIDNDVKKAQRKFEVKLVWCRRPITGNGTAFIQCAPIDKETLLDKYIQLPHGERKIQMSRRGKDLICLGTGQADEQVIKNSILSLVNYDKRISKQLRVTVLRVKVQAEEHEVKEMKKLLAIELKKFSEMIHLPNNRFEIHMIQPKDFTVSYTGFIHFDKLSEGQLLCKFMENKLKINNELVEICPRLKTTLHVPESIMTICQAQFGEIDEYLKAENNVEVNVRKTKLGDYAIEIRSTSAQCLVEARDLYQSKLDGEIIDCNISNLTTSILKREGDKFFKRIENRFQVLLCVDKRKERIHIYGVFDAVVQTKIHILEYFEELQHAKQSEIIFCGNEKPPGLMKEIMKRFGDLPDGIIEYFHLTDANIDFKQQKLFIFGSPEAVTQAEIGISEIEKDLASRVHQHQEKWIPDCVVCMCPVESCTEMYRLEGCGHSYCHTCLKGMVMIAVENKKFPIDCAHGNCSLALVWKDIRFCLKQNWISETKLAERSLDALVATNSSKYKFCKSANCPVVYEVTENKEGHEFNCPACLISLCTSCHSNYHVGLSCEMFVSQHDADKQFEIWKRADPDNRKQCPGCRVPVQKMSGCNCMRCRSCRIYFCWVCLETFPGDQQCYKHLRKYHGGIN